MPTDLTTLSAEDLLARYARCEGRDAVAFCPQEDTAALRTELLRRLRGADAGPLKVCLCGSTRFQSAYLEAQRAETLAGRIVLSVGLFGHQEALDMGGPVKAMLDELHLRKIDLADEVLVLNVKRGHCVGCGKWYLAYPDEGTCDCGSFVRAEPYIGESTRREIAYAHAHGKRVRYLEPSSPDAGGP